MTCPRCAGLLLLVDMQSDEGDLLALGCLLCGYRGGERILAMHQAMDRPPAPYDPPTCKIRHAYPPPE